MDWDTASGCRAGSTPPGGDGSHPRAAAPGCGSCSASPAWPCSPAATTAPGGPWTIWHPRCDPRIPLTAREPQANYGCSPGPDRPALAAGGGQVASGHHAGGRHAALDDRQPGTAAVSAALRPLAGDLGPPRRRPGRPGGRGRAGRGVPALGRRPGQPPRAPTRPGARPWCLPV